MRKTKKSLFKFQANYRNHLRDGASPQRGPKLKVRIFNVVAYPPLTPLAETKKLR